VELLTGLQFLQNVESQQNAIRIRAAPTDNIW